MVVELRSLVLPVKVVPGRSEGPYHGDGNPLSELEMQKSCPEVEE